MEGERCRVCLQDSNDLHPIFIKNEASSPYHKLRRLKLTKFIVSKLSSICSSCLIELDSCVKFFEKCERSNQILSFEYHQHKSVAFLSENSDTFPDRKALEKNVANIRDDEESPGTEAVVPELIFKPCCKWCGSKRKCTHKPPTLFTCDICQKVFTKKFNHSIHVKRHLGIREWPCPTCGVAQVSSWLAKRHCQKGTKFYCPAPNCNRSYTSAHNLTVHIRNHTGDRPYKCSYCGKRFTSKTTLNDHIRIHTGVKPYMCSICGAQFATNKLVAHLKTHSQKSREQASLKPAVRRTQRVGMFACGHCTMSYSHKQSLNRHLRKRHANIQSEKKSEDGDFDVVDNDCVATQSL